MTPNGRLLRAVHEAGLPPGPGDDRPVGEADLLTLPEPAQRYLRFMGAVGLPRVWSFRTRFVGRFRMGRRQPWLACEAWQYNTNLTVARLFAMRLTIAGVIPMDGLDSYVRGRGRMHGTVLGLLTVADGTGPAYDRGELVTFLNDALLVAPSILLGLETRWLPVDGSSFDVCLTDAEMTVSGRVRVAGDGRLLDFATEDRSPDGRTKVRWTTPVEGWTEVDDRRVADRGRAVWHLPDGDLPYAEGHFVAADTRFNVAPATLGEVGPAGPVAGLGQVLGGAGRLAAAVVGARATGCRATPEEEGASLPGDDLVPNPKIVSTRAITIDARPEAVWPWIAQIGKDRGGLYSYDTLENLAGCGIHSADAILPEHQSPEPGDLIRMGPEGYPCYRIAEIRPHRALVLIGADPRTHVVAPLPISGAGASGATWQWELRPVEGGARTRLVARQRIVYPPTQSVLWHIVEPISFVMERRMLRGIKQRAEGHLHAHQEAPARSA